MKFLRWLALILLLSVGMLLVLNYPKLDIISGYAAKNMASTVYIAGRSVVSIEKNDHQVPLIELARAEPEASKASATASVYGFKKRKAVCREGLGCVLLPGAITSAGTTRKPQRFKNSADSLPFPFGNGPLTDTLYREIDYEQLEKAVSIAFENEGTQRTRTVLIAYKNRVIAEKYTDGFTRNTPVLGWSMTKSVLATLFGILSYQGIVDLRQHPDIPEWSKDRRKEINLDHLLRMQSGLEWEEDYTRISDVTRMLFLEADMSRVQMLKPAIAPPGEIWNYSSGTSNLLSGILRDYCKNDQDYLNFPYRELIDKIGMHSMLIETDLAGNFVGSSYGWASTGDWAKFGLLYINEGLWNGERLFNREWVDYVTKPTDHSGQRYGAHFWLNAGGIYPGVPRDLYSANGYQGQYVFIIPSLDLVIVRTGLAEPPDFDLERFLQEVVLAVNR